MVGLYVFRARVIVWWCVATLAGCLGAGIVASISGLMVEYIVAIDVTRLRFPADAFPTYMMRMAIVLRLAVRKPVHKHQFGVHRNRLVVQR